MDNDKDPNRDIDELDVDDADTIIDNAIERIERNAGVRGGKPAVLQATASMDRAAREFGLSADQLTNLLEVILSGKIDDSTSRKLKKLLLPRHKVPENCAIRILGNLGGDLRSSIQASLLRWIILCYDLFDSRSRLQRLYSVVFHYLTYETLRPLLCHILYFMTRREDVKPFRIRKLLDLQVIVGKEPALMGLLHIYKTYVPELILTPLQLSNRTIFKCPDQDMATNISQVQDKWRILNASLDGSTEFGGSKDPIERIGSKRQKLWHIPDVLSVYRKGESDDSMPLSQISSVNALVQHIDNLALPDQLASILSNRLLQHVLALQPSNSIVERISYWLGQELSDLWYWDNKTDTTRARFGHILSKVVAVTMVVKDLLPVIELFLIPFLKVWNGIDYRKDIFTLITYLRPRSFEELYINFLKPVADIFQVSGPVWKSELILCYSRLLTRWAQIKWSTCLKLGDDPRPFVEGSNDLRRLFSVLSPEVDYMESIRAFIHHVDSLSIAALEVENDHVSVQHGVLSFFDVTSTLTSSYNLPLAVVIPDSAVVYRTFLSDSAMAVSRICGIVHQYKQAFETFEQDLQDQYESLVQALVESKLAEGEPVDEEDLPQPPPMKVKGYDRDYVVLFNSFVMDICNFIWRNRAFNKIDKNARGFLLDDQVIAHVKTVCTDGGLHLNSMLSVTHSMAFSGFSARFVKSLESEEQIPSSKHLKGAPTVAILKQSAAEGGLAMPYDELRVRYLDNLEQAGCKGTLEFLFDCISNLSQRRDQSEKIQGSALLRYQHS
ncbi:hypothetical protein BG004_005575 [Podila humilis]|nr:hypothetical protein BG004_005575 [Podila humilis]